MPFNSFLDYPLSWKPNRQKLERPIYLSLALQLEKDIASGVLLPGTKLPPNENWPIFWTSTLPLSPGLTSCVS